jgi:hypothetical protein
MIGALGVVEVRQVTRITIRRKRRELATLVTRGTLECLMCTGEREGSFVVIKARKRPGIHRVAGETVV